MITIKLKRALLCVATLAVAISTGCAKNGHKSRPMDHSDTTFAAGAGRAPTAATSYAFAKMLVSQGRDRDALYVLEKVVREHPKFVPAHNEIAGIYVRADRIDDAITALNIALKQMPNDGVLHNNFGMCNMLLGEYQIALEAFTRATEAVPTNSAFRCNRATALALLGNQEEAKKEYLTVLGVHQTQENLDLLVKPDPARDEKDQPEPEKKVEADRITSLDAVAQSGAREEPKATETETSISAPALDEISIDEPDLDSFDESSEVESEQINPADPDQATESEVPFETEVSLDDMPCSDIGVGG